MTHTEFFEAYLKGQRVFANLDFEELKGSSNGDFSGCTFENCFLWVDFRGSNLAGTKFIRCNLKDIDLRKANLTNAVIKNCLVESAMFKDAIVTGFTFKENYYYGATIDQKDFDTDLINSDAYILKKALSENDYKNLLGSEMIDVTETANPVIDIWDYVKNLVYENIVSEYVWSNNLVEKVYRDNKELYDHILLPTAHKNRLVVIIVSIQKAEIIGHHLLDLAKEYSL